MGEEGHVVWSRSWGRDHCKGLRESEGRMKDPKQSRGIRGSTGDLGGKGEFGPFWTDVPLQGTRDVPEQMVALETRVPAAAVPARQMKWGRCTARTMPGCTTMWNRGPAGTHVSWSSLLRCWVQVAYL